MQVFDQLFKSYVPYVPKPKNIIPTIEKMNRCMHLQNKNPMIIRDGYILVVSWIREKFDDDRKEKLCRNRESNTGPQDD